MLTSLAPPLPPRTADEALVAAPRQSAPVFQALAIDSPGCTARAAVSLWLRMGFMGEEELLTCELANDAANMGGRSVRLLSPAALACSRASNWRADTLEHHATAAADSTPPGAARSRSTGFITQSAHREQLACRHAGA